MRLPNQIGRNIVPVFGIVGLLVTILIIVVIVALIVWALRFIVGGRL